MHREGKTGVPAPWNTAGRGEQTHGGNEGKVLDQRVKGSLLCSLSGKCSPWGPQHWEMQTPRESRLGTTSAGQQIQNRFLLFQQRASAGLSTDSDSWWPPELKMRPEISCCHVERHYGKKPASQPSNQQQVTGQKNLRIELCIQSFLNILGLQPTYRIPVSWTRPAFCSTCFLMNRIYQLPVVGVTIAQASQTRSKVPAW